MKMVPCPRPRVPNQLVSGETEKSVASSAMTADAVTPAMVTWRTRSIARMRSNKPGPPSGCETPGIRRRTGAPRHARTAMASTRSVLTGSKVLSTPGSTMTGTAPRSRPSSATATQIPFPVNGYGDCQCTVERKLGVVARMSVKVKRASTVQHEVVARIKECTDALLRPQAPEPAGADCDTRVIDSRMRLS